MNRQLVEYIQEQLNRGYNINYLRDYLINYGYNPYEVNDAVNYIHLKPKIKPPVFAIAAIAIVALIAVFSVVFIKSGSPKSLLDLELNPLKTEVFQGDELQFNIQLTNMGAAKRYDVSLKHEITDYSKNIITTKEEAIAIETRISKLSSIIIPSNIKPGKYFARTTAYYDSQNPSAGFMFEVKEKAQPAAYQPEAEEGAEGMEFLECPESCDDNNRCTEDDCSSMTEYKCVNIPIKPCCGNNACEETEDSDSCRADCPIQAELPSGLTFGEKIDEIKQTAQTDINKALQLCGTFEKSNERDECYESIFSATNRLNICDMISDINKRDGCYITFAMNNNFADACDKITNENVRESCKAVVG